MVLSFPRLLAVVGLLVLPLYLVLPDAGANAMYEGMLLGTVLLLADRARRESGRRRGPWALASLGLACWWIADLLLLFVWTRDTAPSPSLADAFYIVGALPLAGSLALGARLRSGRPDQLSTVDGMLIAVAVAVPIYVLWIEPAMRAAGLDPLPRLVALGYPASDLLILAVAMRFVLGDGHWPRSTIAFLVGVATLLIGDATYNVQTIAGTYVTPGPVDLFWLVTFVLWSSSAVRPANTRVFTQGARPGGIDVDQRSWVLGLVIALPLAVVARGYVLGDELDATPMIVALGLIGVLIGVRLRIVARRAARAWQGVAILSATALLCIVAAIAVTHSTAAGRKQDTVARQLDQLSTAIERSDLLVARALTTDPRDLQRLLPQIAIAKFRIDGLAAAIDIPEAARVRELQARYAAVATQRLGLLQQGDDAQAVRVALIDVVPARNALIGAVNDLAIRYRDAADRSERRGRATAAIVLSLALLLLWLLMLRFGAASRRAEAAEERSRAVRESEERVRALLGASADPLVIVDADTRVLGHHDLAARLLALPAAAADDELRLDAYLDADQAMAAREAFRAIEGRAGARVRLEWRLRRPDGTSLEAEVSAVDHTADARIGGIVLSVRDISERRRLEAALEHQALHDPLTGLANRALLSDRLTQLFARGGEEREVQALVMLDLDDFRAVNDSFGHRQGDLLLREVATRLVERTAPHDTLARIGGDGFAFLVEDVTSEEDALQRADAMLEAIDAPILLADGSEYLLRGSVGVALGDGTGDGTPGERASLMFRDAELAMYEAKRQEGNSAEVFAPHMHDAVTQRLALRSELALALERQEFFLQYQPIVELRSRTVLGYEALVRWRHPERGLVSPGEFIPVAEQSGLIIELGDWVLREATRQLAEWQQGWDDERYVAVNVAGQQLERADHLLRVREALEASGLAPRQLLLEVTESSLIRDTDASIARLEALRGLGIRLAIDDFGTGYSSLNYLHRFAVDVLKIDKSFIDDVQDGGRGRALVDAIVGMARRLGLTVVAEGIEDAGQIEELVMMRCATGQGFHLGRPLAAEAVPGYEVPGAMRRVA